MEQITFLQMLAKTTEAVPKEAVCFSQNINILIQLISVVVLHLIRAAFLQWRYNWNSPDERPSISDWFRFWKKILSLLPRYAFQPIKAEPLPVTIFIQKTKSVLTISRQEKVSQSFHQCIAKLSPQPVVVDFEGYRLTIQTFILTELSVRAVDYHDTILFKLPHSYNILNAKALKSDNRVTKNLHGLTWESVNYDYFFVSFFVLSLNLQFPNILVYAKDREKCECLSGFFPAHHQLGHAKLSKILRVQ